MPHIISLDLDSVLADTMTAYCDLWNRWFGTKITKEQVTSWDLHRHFTRNGLLVSREETYRFFVDVWQRWDAIKMSEPLMNEEVKKLREKHIVMILTSQQQECMRYIINWLEACDIPHDYLCFVPTMSAKANFPADIYVDDYPYLSQFLPEGKTHFLYTQPWNREVPNNIRVSRIERLSELDALG